MKTFALISCLLAFSFASAQIPSPYASLNSEYNGTGYDTTGMNWFEYDGNGNRSELKTLTWDANQQKLTLQTRNEYSYDSNGKQTERLDFRYNIGTQGWDTASRFVSTYDGNGQVVAQKIDQYNNGWNILSLDSMFYNGNGKVELKKIYWQSGTTYKYSGRHIYSYDSNDSLQSYLYLWLNVNNVDWDTIARYQYSYNSANSVRAIIWENYSKVLGWQNVTLDSTFYNSNGQPELLISMHWSNSLKEWEKTNQVIYTYHSNQSADLEDTETWDKVEKIYLPKYRTQYLYGSPLGIPEEPSTSSILLYPNPAENVLYITNPHAKRDQPIQVVSSGGQLLFQGRMTSTTEKLDLSTWSNGVYFVSIGEGEERVVKTIVKR